ncbi:MAG: NADP-dependent oxidoreductase [Geodermatophilaceae bacterium]|nr:NADP-dependent oxidoreductase [Geodermatophilaceae bacterium]
MPQAFGFSEYGGAETQQLFDLPMPAPGAGELLVRVRAAGVNPVDWKVRQGHLAEVMPLTLPIPMGSEVAGVVEEVGQDVDGFAVHDEVFGSVAPGSGGYAEYTLVTAAQAAIKPPQLSFTDAAVLPVAAGTAFDAVNQLGLTEGQSLLIIGIGGGVGVIAAQLARDAGVFVIGTGSEAKRELTESLGATLVTYGDGVADRIREIMPDGVDAILDLIGLDAAREVADLVSDRSRLLTTADPRVSAELGGTGVERDRSSATLGRLAELVIEGKLDPHVTDLVALDRAGEAVAAVETGHSRGKVVIEVG